MNHLCFKQNDLNSTLKPHVSDALVLFVSISDARLWVAELEGQVVGIVAALRHQAMEGAVELQRMAVDRKWRQFGIGMALGRKVVEFAETSKYSSVVLGTTAYSRAAHKLYERLGFRCVGVTNGYVTPGATSSLLESLFYRVRHHHYSLNLENNRIQNGQQ